MSATVLMLHEHSGGIFGRNGFGFARKATTGARVQVGQPTKDLR
jgi:hypothetical protein